MKYQEMTFLAVLPKEVVDVVKGFGIKNQANIRRIMQFILESYISLLHDVWKSRCKKNVEFQTREDIRKAIKESAEKRKEKRKEKELQQLRKSTSPKKKKPPDKVKQATTI